MKTAIRVFVLICILFSSLNFMEGKTMEAIYFMLLAIYNKPNDSTTINNQNK
jgi:hypothetical protein